MYHHHYPRPRHHPCTSFSFSFFFFFSCISLNHIRRVCSQVRSASMNSSKVCPADPGCVSFIWSNNLSSETKVLWQRWQFLMWLHLKCSWSSDSLYLKTEHPEILQLILWTSLTWLSQSACFTKHFSHCGHPTFLCLLFTCMLHLATFLKCLSQYLHFTWRS